MGAFCFLLNRENLPDDRPTAKLHVNLPVLSFFTHRYEQFTFALRPPVGRPPDHAGKRLSAGLPTGSPATACAAERQGPAACHSQRCPRSPQSPLVVD